MSANSSPATNPRKIILFHLKEISKQLPYVQVDIKYRTLYVAVVDLFTGTIEVLDSGEPSNNSQQQIILLCMDFLLKWEQWLVSGPKFLHKVTLRFHWLLLRAAKGTVKRWRIWRMDLP